MTVRFELACCIGAWIALLTLQAGGAWLEARREAERDALRAAQRLALASPR